MSLPLSQSLVYNFTLARNKTNLKSIELFNRKLKVYHKRLSYAALSGANTCSGVLRESSNLEDRFIHKSTILQTSSSTGVVNQFIALSITKTF